MNAEALFTAALQLTPEWQVRACELDQQARRLTLKLDFRAGSKFPAPGASHQLLCPVHDTVEKTWRHLDFFQYQTELVARVPRVQTPEGSVVQVEVPWARPGSGFTLLFEAWAMLLCAHLPVPEASRLLGETDTRLWRVVAPYVEAAQRRRDWSHVRRLLIDETSARRGHRYVTSVVDADTRELLFMIEGREGAAVAAFVESLGAHGGRPEQIELVAMDMSPAYRKGVREHLPAARIVFDHFHLMQMAGQALDKVPQRLEPMGEGPVCPHGTPSWRKPGSARSRRWHGLAGRGARHSGTYGEIYWLTLPPQSALPTLWRLRETHSGGPCSTPRLAPTRGR